MIFNKRRKGLRLMRQCVRNFECMYPSKSSAVIHLQEKVNKERRYSGHLGSIRDGSESDRQENIKQDKLVTKLQAELEDYVKYCYFGHVVRDVIRDKAWRTGKSTEYYYNLILTCIPNRINLISRDEIDFESFSMDEFNKLKMEK